MLPWVRIGQARAPDGGELVLSERNGEFVIRVDGRELMSSRVHGSEDAMAALGCAHLGEHPAAEVLVGGLGLGYTLRAALDLLGPSARVTVAEIVPAVVDWNRGPLGPLAGRPLDDHRAIVLPRDVGELIAAARGRFDAILLDVDNGPEALTRPENQRLYSRKGLAALDRALAPDGVLVIWSASDDAPFGERLRRAGFCLELHHVPARGPGKPGPKHTLFVARR
jgi:spermidine synthase